MTLAVIPSLPDFELVRTNLEALPGYNENDLSAASEAWTYSCRYFLNLSKDTPFLFNTKLSQWQALARIFLKSKISFRNFLETYFEAFEILTQSFCDNLFTGYFEPELCGSRQYSSLFCYPIYKKPIALIVIEDLGLFRPHLEGHRIAGIINKGNFNPAPSRQKIDQGALKNQGLEICWVQDPSALYFLHVQGCGKIIFEDGTETRLGYDGTNGHAYSSLGKEMLRRGLISLPSSGESIKQVLKSSSQQLREELFWNNPSYVFFKEIAVGEGPRGRIDYPLTPYHSLAVDPRAISLGMPLWFSCNKFSGFMTAQDVGGAIKGLLRGDVFCGTGKKAEAIASNFLEEGRVFILLPREQV